MAYEALYRRYRPSRFEDAFFGQDHVKAALINAIEGDRVGHAYLFSGPRGTGKTTSARILAKALNCTNLQGGEPCNECDSCEAFGTGSSYDLHELDAASNNGVDAMRDLIGKVALGSPGRTKVYILDEVHMLSSGAENALLKTLEEPPPHVVFVLCTTEPNKVVPTIRSRTQHLEFSLLNQAEVGALVDHVTGDAGIEITPEDRAYVIRAGGGSARDTLSALDQVVAAGGAPKGGEHLESLFSSLAARDSAAALTAIDGAMQAGRDPAGIATSLLSELRSVFLVTMRADLSHLPDAERERAEAFAASMPPARVTRAIEALGTSVIDMRSAPDPRVDLEVAVMRLTRTDLDVSPAALLERIEALESGSPRGPAPAQGLLPASPSSTSTEAVVPSGVESPTQQPGLTPQAETVAAVTPSAPTSSGEYDDGSSRPGGPAPAANSSTGPADSGTGPANSGTGPGDYDDTPPPYGEPAPDSVAPSSSTPSSSAPLPGPSGEAPISEGRRGADMVRRALAEQQRGEPGADMPAPSAPTHTSAPAPVAQVAGSAQAAPVSGEPPQTLADRRRQRQAAAASAGAAGVEVQQAEVPKQADPSQQAEVAPVQQADPSRQAEAHQAEVQPTEVPEQVDPSRRAEVQQAEVPEQVDPSRRAEVQQGEVPEQVDPSRRAEVQQGEVPEQVDPSRRAEVQQGEVPEQVDPSRRAEVQQAEAEVAPVQRAEVAPVQQAEAAPAPTPGSGGSVPSLNQLEAAWSEGMLETMSGRVRSRFSAGRWMDSEPDTAVFGLPNPVHRDRCEEVRAEVDSALTARFGAPVPLKLVVDTAEVEPDIFQTGSAASMAQDDTPGSYEEEEPVDMDGLVDAGNQTSATGVELVLETFEGSVVLEDPSPDGQNER